LLPYLDDTPSLPVAEAAAREVLCLPLFPQLGEAQLDEVCAAVRELFAA
jgi:dTDP-4-amino-4,6-dideoxygalactose transaminase